MNPVVPSRRPMLRRAIASLAAASALVALGACGSAERPPSSPPPSAPPTLSSTSAVAAPAASAADAAADEAIRGFVFVSRGGLFGTEQEAKSADPQDRLSVLDVAFAVVADRGPTIEVATLDGRTHCAPAGDERPLVESFDIKGFVPRAWLARVLTRPLSVRGGDGTSFDASPGTPVTAGPTGGLVTATGPFFMPVDPSSVALSYAAWQPPGQAVALEPSHVERLNGPLTCSGQKFDVSFKPPLLTRCDAMTKPRCESASRCWHAVFDASGKEGRPAGGAQGIGGLGPMVRIQKGAPVWFTDGSPAGRVRDREVKLSAGREHASNGRRCFGVTFVGGGLCFDPSNVSP